MFVVGLVAHCGMIVIQLSSRVRGAAIKTVVNETRFSAAEFFSSKTENVEVLCDLLL